LLFICLLSVAKLSAQTCDPEADFTFTEQNCRANFNPLTFNGPGTIIANDWKFYNASTATGPFSASSVANPIFMFLPSGSNWVSHAVKILLPNGNIINKICAKAITLSNCQEQICAPEYYFYYTVNGCEITITQVDNIVNMVPVVWLFGDGTTSTLPLPSHTYTASGDYLVSVSFNGKPCFFPIRVNCGEVACCTAAFEANINRDCGKLVLSLNAECISG
jgi:PKD repeat protein